MDQAILPQPSISIAAKVMTYLAALVNGLVAGNMLFDTFTGNRFPGADGIRFIFGLWFFGVLIFSFYSLIKPAWIKFYILILVLGLEAGTFFYSLYMALM